MKVYLIYKVIRLTEMIIEWSELQKEHVILLLFTLKALF